MKIEFNAPEHWRDFTPEFLAHVRGNLQRMINNMFPVPTPNCRLERQTDGTFKQVWR